MGENQSGVARDGYVAAVLQSEAARSMSRMAVVLDRGATTFALQAIREQLPTFCVASLRELTAAFSAAGESPVCVFDIREIPREDIAIFASCLAESFGSRGVVYVLTREQWDVMDGVHFDFVSR
jgi:hypothetical protein